MKPTRSAVLALALALSLLAVVVILLSWSWISTERVPYRVDGMYSGDELYEFSTTGWSGIVPAEPRDALGWYASPRWSNDSIDGPAVLWDAATGFRVWQTAEVAGGWVTFFWTPNGVAVGALRSLQHPTYYPPGVPAEKEPIARDSELFPANQLAATAPWVKRAITADQWWEQVRPTP